MAEQIPWKNKEQNLEEEQTNKNFEEHIKAFLRKV